MACPACILPHEQQQPHITLQQVLIKLLFVCMTTTACTCTQVLVQFWISAGALSGTLCCTTFTDRLACLVLVPVHGAAWSQFADSIGLPTDEGIFGFKPFAEVWCGEYRQAGCRQQVLLPGSCWHHACMREVLCCRMFSVHKLKLGLLCPSLCAGRLAMMGFVVSIVEEAMGNGGTLAQIGVDTPSITVLGLALGLAGTATLVGTANTAYKLFSRKMTPGDIARWEHCTAPVG
jgi:hypothetical protein